jgi:pimeloyl-ACP methyl ester carboxylesterase
MEYFARQGRVLTAELRGHGESDKPQQAYSIEGFAEDLVWLCTRQQITKPVIVGQSMGGNMALEIAAGHPEFPAGLVLLDSGVLFPASAATVFAGYLEGLRGPDFADQVRRIVADSCLPTDTCRAHVEQTFLATPQHVLVSTSAAQSRTRCRAAARTTCNADRSYRSWKFYLSAAVRDGSDHRKPCAAVCGKAARHDADPR